MSDEREHDPVSERLDERDLYDVADWEPRSPMDAAAVVVHRALRAGGGFLLVLAAFVLLAAQAGIIGYAIYLDPQLGLLAVLSVLPALLLVGFVWYQDATMREPLVPLAVTFLLGVLFAAFAAVVNSFAEPLFRVYVPAIGMLLFFFLVVGPVEEAVKWLAVRAYAFTTDDFDAVTDGAVYGAVAGLGFATIENALYITRTALRQGAVVGSEPLRRAVETATARAFVGPGHVIYSSFSGYYLGLAKFNREYAGAVAVKGLLVAASIHGLYDALVTYLPRFGVSLDGFTFVAFVVTFDGVFGYLLYRKLGRYRDAYRRATKPGGRGKSGESEEN